MHLYRHFLILPYGGKENEDSPGIWLVVLVSKLCHQLQVTVAFVVCTASFLEINLEGDRKAHGKC